MRKLAYVATALAVVLSAAPAAGQGLPFSLEGRAGLAFPTGDFSELLGSGITVGGHAHFNVTRTVGIYGGYTFNRFDFDDDAITFADENLDVHGFDAGLQVRVPRAGISPFVKGGLVYHKREISNGRGESDRELGFEFGAGFEYALGQVLSVSPAVSFVQVPGEDEFDPFPGLIGPIREDASFVKVDIGLRLKL